MKQAQPDAAALVASGAAAAAAVGLVFLRTGRGVQPYGTHGAAWIEHAERLAFVQAWGRRDTLGLRAWMDEVDGLFPPGLHAITSVWGAIVGHGAADVANTGVFWLLLLAAAVASVTRSLGGGIVPAAAAFAASCLLPAAHAFASRYYYDLPMTALLWLAVAVALKSWDQRPVLGGLTAGLIWALADLVKWAALPFGGLLLLAAVLVPHRDRRWGARLVALVLATAVSAGMSAGWITLAGGESSLAVMLDQMWGGAGGGAGSVGEMLAGLQGWVADKGLFLGTRIRGDRIGFYAVQWFTAVFSPVLGVAFLLLALRGGRTAGALALAAPALLGGFLVLWIPVLDERFLLTAAPALLPAAAIGLFRLPPKVARPLGLVLAAWALWVGAAFHGLAPDLPGPRWERTPPPSSSAPRLAGRGLGLMDSVERRGWSHAHTTPDPQPLLRARIWSEVERVKPESLAVPEGPTEASPAGEFHWVDYRSLLAQIDGGPPALDFAEDCSEDVDAVLSAAPRAGPPLCAPEGLRELERWPAADERFDLVLLSR